MKISLIILMIAITLGCSNEQRYSDILSRADSIVETNPDSALTIISNINDTSALGSDGNRALYYLLLTQVQHRCYKSTTVDSLLDFSIAYYNKVGDDYNLARSYYYRGITLYKHQYSDSGIVYLKKGEEIAQSIDHKLLLLKFYESLFVVNKGAKYANMMLKYAKLFLNNSLEGHDSNRIVRAYTDVALSYEALGFKDSTDMYIMRCLPILNKVDKIYRAMAFANIGIVFHDRRDYKNAKIYLQKSLKLEQRDNAQLVLAEIYYNEGNVEEAKKLWKKAMETDHIDIRISTMKSITDYYLKQNDYENAYRLANEINHLSDSLTKASDNAEIAEIQLRYDNQAAKTKSYKIITFILSALIMLLIVSFSIIYLSRRHVKKLSCSIKAKNSKIADAEQKLKEMEKAGEKGKKEITKLKTKVKEKKESVAEMIGQGRNVYDRIRKDNKMPCDIPDAEKCLIEYYLVANNEKYREWKAKYNTNKGQMIYLVLHDMGYSDKEMEQILSVADTTIRSKKSRLKLTKQ